MLRYLVVFLYLANLLMFTVAYGVFGPLPSAGPREPYHLIQQIHPEWLTARALHPEDSADQPQVGGAAPVAPVRAAPLGQ